VLIKDNHNNARAAEEIKMICEYWETKPVIHEGALAYKIANVIIGSEVAGEVENGSNKIYVPKLILGLGKN
jgi:hypothetical protein